MIVFKLSISMMLTFFPSCKQFRFMALSINFIVVLFLEYKQIKLMRKFIV